MAPGQVARRVSELQRIASDANARLIFERGGMLDAGAGGQALLTKLIGTNFGIGSGAHKAALARRESIRSSLGDRCLSVRVTVQPWSPLAIGLGTFAPLTETGFTLDRTLGVPYLPGSALKGVARNLLHERGGDTSGIFGTEKVQGSVRFLDALSMLDVRVDQEVMTPHFGPWYEKAKAPGEWFSPVPVMFLVLRSGSFVVDLVGNVQGACENARDLLVSALDELGFGAKTSSGFGRLGAVS